MWCPNPKCQLWELIEGDLYCSWCGATLLDLTLAIDAGYLYVGDPATDLTLLIKHAGALGVVQLESVVSEKTWLRIKADQQANTLPGRSLGSGEFMELTLEADPSLLPDDYNKAKIIVASSVGLREVTLEAVPKPKLDKVSTGGEHTILLNSVSEERLTGYLAISRGVVTIESLQTDKPQWASVVVINQEIPCTLDARKSKRLEFEFKIDEMQLFQEIQKSGESYPVERTANLTMKFAGMEAERTWPFYVKCWLPPRLNIPEAEAERAIDVDAFIGNRAEFGLTLENFGQGAQGRAKLEILKIESDVSWLRPTSAIVYPLTIASGQFQHVTFAGDVDKLGVGRYHAKLIFSTNAPGAEKQKPVFVGLKVRKMPDFIGVLAIDFGTTNSCCAYIDRRGRKELIPIGEGNDKSTTTSSTILYKDLFDDGRKHYEIGNNAYDFSLYGAFSRCTVKQVKRSLGTQRQYEIRFDEDPAKKAVYTPREVTTDILRRILAQAEEKLQARIKACTVSHPSRFSVRQIDDLKAAIVSCGIEDKAITLVHEPVAAALDFIRGEEIRKKYEDYHLMVFDFGGGTIDVTLIKVVNEPQPGRPMVYVKPDVLGVTGDPQFGGEDVTDSVLRLIHAKCEEVLTAKNESATKCIVPIEEEQFRDQRYKGVARNNRRKLRGRAEATKIAIASYGDGHIAKVEAGTLQAAFTKTILLDVIVDNNLQAAEFLYKDIAPLKEQIDDGLRLKLTEIVESMKRLAKKRGIAWPEVILLSGKSSALPIVREVVGEGFPKSNIEITPNLKECVVQGACLLTEEEPQEGVAVKFEPGRSLSAMTSSLGISVGGLGGRRFKKAIEVGEPIGEAGARGMIERDVDFTRRSHITIYENTGVSNNLVEASGKDNPNITELKSFKLESKLSDWERVNNKRISAADIANAIVELLVTPNFKVKLTARIPGIKEPFEFEAEYIGG